ncbi:polyphosphate:AMP phosphotransferase [Halopseudomonas nanhaiensis]|uniref:polyphosphate:AMP phosphotransferase n=1 Tax=Halopseudomonas nanhaiensis TaxID=2830842 RepID=UPI001CBF1DE2|nr:polyphosphate:AMP phosphotransferase [Halopseudomonas nanhaiensis]UAW99063.1 polyphosphate:AMP phosphotransferase [Halopseudomonas nanhaiensis]
MSEDALPGKELKKLDAALTEALLNAQYELRQSGRGPLLVLISGNDFAGKAEAIYAFYKRLDNRHLNTRAFSLPTGLDRDMPRLWRYWRSLPPAGEIGFYLGSWYHQPLMQYSRGEISREQFDQQMLQLLRFEQLLVDDGVGIIKLWLHLTPQHGGQQQSLVEPGEQSVAMREWGDFSAADYEDVRAGAARMRELTSTDESPWHQVLSHDPDYRDIRIGELVLDACVRVLERTDAEEALQWIGSPERRQDQLDFSLALKKSDYKEQLEHYQTRLRELIRHSGFAQRSLLLVFEGTDAAGKGGSIRRITECLDPRQLRVHGTSAPTPEERSHPYLWRFWRRIPRPGTVVVFDRSHYGRVLVERVEEFISPNDWRRAYAEINDFERQLAEAGTAIIKFWLSISADEQLRRFQAREQTPVKRYKLTDEDWRNRAQWPAYQQAMNDMVARTSTRQAPWHLIPAEDKRYARIETLRIVCESLETALGLR